MFWWLKFLSETRFEQLRCSASAFSLDRMCRVVLSRYSQWNDTHRTPLFSGAWCYQGRNTKPQRGSCPLPTSGGAASEPFSAKCSAVGIWHCCESDNFLDGNSAVKIILSPRAYFALCVISHKRNILSDRMRCTIPHFSEKRMQLASRRFCHKTYYNRTRNVYSDSVIFCWLRHSFM